METLSTEHCLICDVKFTSVDHASSHYAGRKHKKKASDIYSQSAATNGQQQQNYCQYCRISVSGPAPMKQHQESARHIKKVQEASQRSRQGSDADASQASPTGSTYNEFDIKPDTTTIDGSRQDVEERQVNGEASVPPGNGPSTLLSNPPPRGETSSLLCDIQPHSTKTVIRKQNGFLPHGLQLTPDELSAKLNSLAMKDFKHQLIESCKKAIQQELEQIIPRLAEAIVDKTLMSLQEAETKGVSAGKATQLLPHVNHVDSQDEGSLGSYQTPANSVCSQLFSPSYQTACNSLGSQSFTSSSYHSAHTSFPPPGFSHLNGVDDNRFEQNAF